jgi:hypothetical protein
MFVSEGLIPSRIATRLRPLRICLRIIIFLYDDGLVRLASEKYNVSQLSKAGGNAQDYYGHLKNYSYKRIPGISMASNISCLRMSVWMMVLPQSTQRKTLSRNQQIISGQRLRKLSLK